MKTQKITCRHIFSDGRINRARNKIELTKKGGALIESKGSERNLTRNTISSHTKQTNNGKQDNKEIQDNKEKQVNNGVKVNGCFLVIKNTGDINDSVNVIND